MTEATMFSQPSDETVMLARRIRELKGEFLKEHNLRPHWVRLGLVDLKLIPEGSTVTGLVVMSSGMDRDDIEVGISKIEEFTSQEDAYKTS